MLKSAAESADLHEVYLHLSLDSLLHLTLNCDTPSMNSEI